MESEYAEYEPPRSAWTNGVELGNAILANSVARGNGPHEGKFVGVTVYLPRVRFITRPD